MQQTLIDADEVRESRSDPLVRLYCRRYSSLHLCVVVKQLNYRVSQAQKDSGKLPVEVRVA